MVTLKDAAQQALDYIRSTTDYKMGHPPACEAALDLADALAEQPAEQEPVAWVVKMPGGYHDCGYDSGVLNKVPHGTMLYTAPQPRREVELTDEEIDRALDAANVPELPGGYESVELEIARAVIKAYKAKQGETK